MLTHDDAQAINGAQGELVAGIRKAFEPFIKTKTVLYWLDEYARFYEEVFGFHCNFSKLRAPVSREGFNWLIVADHRVTTNTALQKCKELFTARKVFNYSLDHAIPTNDRSEKDGDYAIWVRDTVEAEPVQKNQSANDLHAARVKGMTMRERLILELWYEWKNRGQHLDIQNWTLCSGSRNGDGDVLCVGWGSDDRQLCVILCSGGYRDDNLRFREVIS